MKKLEKREIESFQMKGSYYKKSWLLGNKTHVKTELAELLVCNIVVALRIIAELPRAIRIAVVESEQIVNADWYIRNPHLFKNR